jgi:20S proteasome subunit alpha 6
MFRNQYDTDITTWSPQGRLYQVEYAMEAVKQGSATVACKSSTHAVVASLKRAPQADLASYQAKAFPIADHCGMAIAGLISDARVLARYMRTECMNYEFMYGSVMPIPTLMNNVADKCQHSTQSASKRPFGVGALVIGSDDNGVHLFQTCPSGNAYAAKAASIGARSQSARTYLERHYETFPGLVLDDLIPHALKALATTCGEGVKLNAQNTSISIVGTDMPFTTLSEEQSASWLDRVKLSPEDRVPETAEEVPEEVFTPADQ